MKITGARGKRLEESKKINQSLSALGNVIFCLIKKIKDKQTHIPYRNSKLTRLLEDSLGGNCITTFMGMISPGQENFSESFSTLKFANRTKKIKNKPKINEELDQELLIRKYEDELRRLRKLMTDKRRGMGQSKLLQLEEEKEKAEKDKHQMMRKLQEQSQKFMEEREEKRQLEIKINHLQSQLDVYRSLKKQFGGEEEWGERGSGEGESPDYAIGGFEKQLKELEQQKAHLNQYKDLLRRQRDIMVALTNKLNERDEAIVHLQSELSAFDKMYSEMENMMKFKDAQFKFVSANLHAKGMSIEELLKGFEEGDSQTSESGGRYSQRYSDIQEKEDLIQQNLKHLVFGEEKPEMKQEGEPKAGQLKTRIDMIIDELAGKKEPETLERVAKDLLGLQKMIGVLWEKKVEKETEGEKFVLNRPSTEESRDSGKRWSEKLTEKEVDMRQINYESLFEKAKLVKKHTEEEINQFKVEPTIQKKQTYDNILSKFEEIKSSFLDFSKKEVNKENNGEGRLAKQSMQMRTSQTKRTRTMKRPKSQAFRESKTRVDNDFSKQKKKGKKDSVSQSRIRNKSFSSTKFRNSENRSARKLVSNATKKGSFLSRKSGGFNEVNSKLQNILSNGKKGSYMECRYSGKFEGVTEKKVEGLLRDNNILNLVPKVSNLK